MERPSRIQPIVSHANVIDLEDRLMAAEARVAKLEYAAQLAADWINNDFVDVTDNGDGTTTVDDEQIETCTAKGEAIRQALLDALNP